MKRALSLLAGLLAINVVAAQTPRPSAPTVAQIKRAIIQASIASYTGSCPCPYNVDRGGRRCGRRSAYNRPGGASPICFEEDITAAMVEAYRYRPSK
jgi:hypothetical protein